MKWIDFFRNLFSSPNFRANPFLSLFPFIYPPIALQIKTRIRRNNFSYFFFSIWKKRLNIWCLLSIFIIHALVFFSLALKIHFLKRFTQNFFLLLSRSWSKRFSYVLSIYKSVRLVFLLYLSLSPSLNRVKQCSFIVVVDTSRYRISKKSCCFTLCILHAIPIHIPKLTNSSA